MNKPGPCTVSSGTGSLEVGICGMNENRYNPEDQPERELTIIQGRELELRVSEDILSKKEFMYTAFRQAADALVEIARHTKKFEDNVCGRGDAVFEEELFQYSGNVIAFVGQRGAGKTQTMLSFSHALADGEKIRRYSTDLEDCRFFVMPPISPSVLEKSRGLLYVVLSRIYRYVNMALEKDDSRLREDSALHMELWETFNKCVSGINGISAGSGGEIGDVSQLQDTVDGLALRESFYKLIKMAVGRVLKKGCRGQGFLVLQVDDADSQIENGYAVLEDVRRYLLVPNLVILMSSDMELLHSVVMQNHMRQFADLIKAGDLIGNELSRTCRKYIDKLIPPSHMIHLPRLEQVADLGGGDIKLRYVNDGGGNVLGWNADMPRLMLQDTVLVMIFKKTGMIFASHESQLNHMIPRSLRGLNQMLYLLSEMDDIPDVPPELWDTPYELATEILGQYRVASKNLQRFADYFFYDWIEVKVCNPDDRAFLRQLVAAPRANFVSEVQAYLQEKYAITSKESALKNMGNDQWTLYDIDQSIINLERFPLNADERMLFFVIGTIRTIRGHIAAWQVKLNTANGASSYRLLRNPVFVCDYDPQKWNITASFPALNAPFVLTGLSDKEARVRLCINGKQLTFRKIRESHQNVDKSVQDAFLEIITYHGFPGNANLLNFITLFLRLGMSAFEVETSFPLNAQPHIYRTQEMALQVALNWDVVSKVCRELADRLLAAQERPAERFVDNLVTAFECIDDIMKDLNKGAFATLWPGMGIGDEMSYSLADAIRIMFRTKPQLGNLTKLMTRDEWVFFREDKPKPNPNSDSKKTDPMDAPPSGSDDSN